jgi:RNA polymerase sigma-70 factor (ECF subfamily)
MEGGDATVVARVRAGDRDAFRVLVERYSRMLFAQSYRMLNNEDDAEEVVQEAFLRAYRSLTSFEERANFGTWIYRIAANCALDLLSRRKTQPQPVAAVEEDEDPPELRVASSAPDPEQLAYSGEMQRRIAAAMDGLTPVERTAFVMRHFEGRSVEEISATLKVRAGAAKQSIFRAVQKMRAALEPAIRSAR